MRSTPASSTSRDTPPVAAASSPARWEWREFAYQPPEQWTTALGATTMHHGSLSSETYLLVADPTVNVKVRNGRLEIKQLLATDFGGLQQWRPTLEAAFPLTSAALATLLDIWHCERGAPWSPHNSVRLLIDQLVARVPGLQVMPLTKWRRAFDVEGCRAERTTILARGTVLESLAFEHEDPLRLRAVLEARRLDPGHNTSYPEALGRLAGWPAATTHPGAHQRG